MSRFKLREIWLAAHAVFVLMEARYRLRHTSVDRMRRWAAMEGRQSCAREQLLLAFRRAANRTKGTCLVRALALQRFLSSHGYCSELHIGVGRTERGFEAHAWLMDGEDILDEAGRGADDFTLLATWPAGRNP